MTEQITQADRVAAANCGLDNSLIVSADYQPIIDGRRDDNGLIQALARHRIAAEEGKAELVREIAALTDEFIFASDADVFRLIDGINAALARVRGEG